MSVSKPTKRQQKRNVGKELQSFLQENLKTAHGRIILCGLLVGLCYFPVWLGVLIERAFQGSPGLPLMLGVVGLALHELWKQRTQLAKEAVGVEDRLLGHILILSGVVFFPFYRTAIWSQSLIWLIILIGIACSSWGIGFFRKQTVPALLMALSVYPRPGETTRLLWELVTPYRALDHFMAWAGGLTLRAIGQTVEVQGAFVALPQGSVEVGWGCNGFSMAVNIAMAGLVMGLLLKQSWQKVLLIMAFGAGLALVLNIPRITLVTLASVYWGQYWFDFWHGSWGSQIFMSVVFTIYYYIIMGVTKRRSPKART